MRYLYGCVVFIILMGALSYIGGVHNGTVVVPIPLEAPVLPSETFSRKIGSRVVEPEEYSLELNCMIKTLWHESRGEPLKGQQWVAQTVMNRVEHKRHFPNTVCDVVRQRIKGVCQFSFICERTDYSINVANLTRQEREVYVKLIQVAKDALDGKLKGITTVAFYKRCDVNSRFFNKLEYRERVGKHCWYSDTRNSNTFG